MKSLFLSLIILCGSLCASASDFSPLPPELDGSMMPYDFSSTDSIRIPEGFTPVHISYVARHGARYLSSAKKTEVIEKALKDAETDDGLSEDGKEFLKFIHFLKSFTNQRWGLLSEVGINEEMRLGEDLAVAFPSLLAKGKASSISTFVPRVIMTMYQFNHSMERRHQGMQLFTASGHQNDSLLYCFDTFSDYRNFRDSGSWKKIYDAYVDRNVSPDPAARLFINPARLGEKKLRKLSMEMYGVLQGNRASGIDAPTTRWFSVKEYEQCYRASNLKHYLRNTPNLIDPWCASATSMLIERIISDADEALRGGGIAFNGYFGHCETLLPMLATMNIPGCYLRTADYNNIESKWKLQEISPLGANLCLIFLKGTGDDICVCIRLNGKNIPPYPGAPEIIKWEELKAYWQQRIASFNRPKARLL